MSKRPSDFVKAFKCKRCGKIMVNDPDYPELNERISELDEPGRLEAHTKILEHSRDSHDGDFIDMYERVELSPEKIGDMIKRLHSDEGVTV